MLFSLGNGSIEFYEFLKILKCGLEYNNNNNSNNSNGNINSNTKNDQTQYTNSKTSTNTDKTYATNTNSKITLTNSNHVKNTDIAQLNIKLLFDQFDKDNDGKISKNELRFVMCNLFPDEVITEEDINEMLQAADLDRNGFIEFEGICLVFFY